MPIMDFARLEHSVLELFVAPNAMVRMSGFYNDNFKFSHNEKEYVLRTPIVGQPLMDLRCLPEPLIMKTLRDHYPKINAPRLIHTLTAQEKSFCVYTYEQGDSLEEYCPDASHIPDWVLLELVSQISTLHKYNPVVLNDLARIQQWGKDADGFYHYLINFVTLLIHELYQKHHALYESLRLPHDVVRCVLGEEEFLDKRTCVLCHCDIHRKNILIDPATKHLTIIDWELSLVADPIYDIATHLHRMHYPRKQEDLFINTYNRIMGFYRGGGLLKKQIDIYRRIERIKSAYVDCVRVASYLKTRELTHQERFSCIEKYYAILSSAYPLCELPHTQWVTKEEVFSILSP